MIETKSKKIKRFLISIGKNHFFELINLFIIIVVFIFDIVYHNRIYFIPKIDAFMIATSFPVVGSLSANFSSSKDELILGVKKSTFLNLKNDGFLSFPKMFSISFILIVSFSIFSTLNLVLLTWVITVQSVLYTILFIIKYSTIFWKDNDNLLKVAFKIVIRNLEKNINKEFTNNKDIEILIQNILMKWEIEKIMNYNFFKNKNEYQNFLMKLLPIQSQNMKLLINKFEINKINNCPIEYNFNLEFIYKNIAYNIKNIEDLFSKTQEKYIDEIAISILYLRRLSRFEILKDIVDAQTSEILSDIFIKLKTTVHSTDNLISILNNLVIHSLINEDFEIANILWSILKSENVDSQYKYQYIIYTSLFFISVLDNQSNSLKSFKEKVNSFVKSQKDFQDTNWKEDFILCSIGEYWRSPELLLNDLIKLYRIGFSDLCINNTDKLKCNDKINFYKNIFSYEKVINWWINYFFIISPLYISLNRNDFKINLKFLNEQEKKILYKEIDKKWSNYNNAVKNLENKTNILQYDWTKNNNQPYFIEQTIQNLLFLKNGIIDKKDLFINEITYKEKLTITINKSITNLKTSDKSIELHNSDIENYEINFDYFSMESKNIDEYLSNKYLYFANDELYKKVELYLNKENICKVLSCFSEEELIKIINFEPQYFDDIWRYEICVENQTNVELLQKINLNKNVKNIFSINDKIKMFFRNNGIKANFELIENEIIIRKMRAEEINKIIDEKYKLHQSGHYYFHQKISGYKVLLSREELVQIISNTSLHISMPIKNKLKFNRDNILCFQLDKNKAH
ncbi:hypothetical protein SAMN02745179_00841 [Mycoplasmopsis agassizii]|uniref:Uncharacterized protein n=2 Tax=Mycoplasmopsis agassizii TaxID=33922 RepID=A0ABX4H5B1_9BACT|nr:hypothetical protein CJF60_00100 [Mycoplasmopsis agassizii]SMC19128.1 hypothetical protein SAMN02745179_00841 [Mycoplasmopsis agassizii]